MYVRMRRTSYNIQCECTLNEYPLDYSHLHLERQHEKDGSYPPLIHVSTTSSGTFVYFLAHSMERSPWDILLVMAPALILSMLLSCLGKYHSRVS